MWASSNPTLANDDIFQKVYQSPAAPRTDVTTLQGVANKTVLLVSVAIVAGALGYSVFTVFPAALWIGCIAALITGIGVCIVLTGKPHLAKALAPVYAVVEGFFLGAFTCLADNILADRGLSVMGGVGLQAFIITAASVGSMLALYKMRILQPTQKFKAVITTATMAIMVAYLVSFVMSLFGATMPLISVGAAVSEHGTMGLLGLGINLFILVIASLWLIIDFGMIEEKVNAGAPKVMEWYCGFALLVTLAWIYFEAVKLVLRIAILLGNRD